MNYPAGAVAPFTGVGCNTPGFRPGPGGKYCLPTGGSNLVTPYTGNPIPFQVALPSVGAVARVGTAAVGLLGGVGDVADLICRYFPNVCNIAVPGQPYPTPSPRTPAPPTANTPIVAGYVPGSAVCPTGHHLNKTRYLTRQGVVEPGTRCVKNRRMNPTNPRALVRAIRRGDRFVALAKSFGMGAPAKGLKKRRRRC